MVKLPISFTFLRVTFFDYFFGTFSTIFKNQHIILCFSADVDLGIYIKTSPFSTWWKLYSFHIGFGKGKTHSKYCIYVLYLIFATIKGVVSAVLNRLEVAWLNICNLIRRVAAGGSEILLFLSLLFSKVVDTLCKSQTIV